ncbi:hypothetical protein [Paenibacillus sp. UNC451MF]|uniref:hypothetical protein n=1 Tax=Paenibacillus sp. UNC451MF TaxID=1449063 RepID=UPI00048B7B58|nr:hypothetical protein [Paenibacillus sp. UNC451MF]
MQKLASFLLDIVGLFFQGLIFIAAIGCAYGLLIDWSMHERFLNSFHASSDIISYGLQQLAEEGALPMAITVGLVIVGLIGCYLIGIIISYFGKWLLEQGPLQRNRAICFKENTVVLEAVKLKLYDEFHVTLREIRIKMGWAPFYRWASHLSSIRGWKTPLLLYKLRCSTYRSLTGIFVVAVCFVIMLQLLNLVLSYFYTVNMHWTMFVVLCIGFLAAAYVSKRFYEEDYLRTGNESVMILNSYFTSSEGKEE